MASMSSLRNVPGDVSFMDEGQTLVPGRALVSDGGRYRLAFQHDGNLVLYRNEGNIPVWDWGCPGLAPATCTLTPSGLVITATDGTIVRQQQLSDATYLVITDNGCFTIFDNEARGVWDSLGSYI